MALELVLRHELHHLANGDLRRSKFMTVCAVALWWHPLMWWLRRTHAAASEELGDRTAARGEVGREREDHHADRGCEGQVGVNRNDFAVVQYRVDLNSVVNWCFAACKQENGKKQCRY